VMCKADTVNVFFQHKFIYTSIFTDPDV
jgi:hypothetical protein